MSLDFQKSRSRREILASEQDLHCFAQISVERSTHLVYSPDTENAWNYEICSQYEKGRDFGAG
jgi:hypothetical protein